MVLTVPPHLIGTGLITGPAYAVGFTASTSPGVAAMEWIIVGTVDPPPVRYS
jgi:hypothetical protein